MKNVDWEAEERAFQSGNDTERSRLRCVWLDRLHEATGSHIADRRTECEATQSALRTIAALAASYDEQKATIGALRAELAKLTS